MSKKLPRLLTDDRNNASFKNVRFEELMTMDNVLKILLVLMMQNNVV
jgi:hypothetical protein